MNKSILENLTKEDLIKIIGNIYDVLKREQSYDLPTEKAEILNTVGKVCVDYCVKNDFNIDHINFYD